MGGIRPNPGSGASLEEDAVRDLDAIRADVDVARSLDDLARGRDVEPPFGSALFPEIPTWSDEQLVIAIELADRREPGLNLYAVGDLPDRHEAFLHECSAELVRRLEERGVRFAA
jgi:hypothetical protein